jgi:hypothetical protein
MVVGEVAGAIDLKGVWASMDFKCRNTVRPETVLVDVVNGTLKATKVEGDECVPSGFVVIEGKLPKPSLLESELPVTFTFKLYDGAAGVPATIAVAESGTGKVMTPNLIVLTLAETQLRLTRVVPGTGSAGSTEEDDTGRAGGGGRSGAGGRSARAGSGGSTPSGSGGAGKRGTGSAGRAGSASGDDTDSDSSSGARDAGAGDAASGDDDTSGEAGSGGDNGAAGSGASGRGGAGGRSGGSGRGAAGGSGGSSGLAGSGGSGGSSAADNCPGPILKGATCDQVAQCGCQVGESCRFDGAKPPSCFPAGKVKEGYPCKADSECVAGSVCVEELGLCYRQCREKSDCGADGSCLAVAIDGAEVDGFGVCLERCEPVLDESCFEPGGASSIECNACVSGAACVPLEGVPTTGCVKAKTPQKMIGQACSEHSECAGGGCLNGECRAWCRTDADCVQFGSTCLGDLEYFKSPGDEIGLCDATDASAKPDSDR